MNAYCLNEMIIKYFYFLFLSELLNKEVCTLIQELPLNLEKTMVWCDFFKNDAGEKVKGNGDRYGAMITDYR